MRTISSHILSLHEIREAHVPTVISVLKHQPKCCYWERCRSVSPAHNSHDSRTVCPVTRHGQSGNQQDSRTVLFLHGCLHLKHFRKNEKSYLLAGLNESFWGAEWKSRMPSCFIFVSNEIGQNILLNIVLWFDSEYKGSGRVLLSNNRI